MRPKVHFKHKEFYFEFNCNFICIKAQITYPGSPRQFTCALQLLVKMGNSPVANNKNHLTKMLGVPAVALFIPCTRRAPIIAR